MCRNIRTLHNFAPPATREEIDAAALQYVRKIAGTVKPSEKNQVAFERAVRDVAKITDRLLSQLVAGAPPKNREQERRKAKLRAQKRFTRA